MVKNLKETMDRFTGLHIRAIKMAPQKVNRH